MLITRCAMQASCEVQQLIFSNKTTENEKPQVSGRHTALMEQESMTCMSLILESICRVNELGIWLKMKNQTQRASSEGTGFNFHCSGETTMQDGGTQEGFLM